MINIKTVTTTLFAIAFLAISGFTATDKPAEAMAWKIDSAHSNISFNVRHFFTPVTGQFKDYSSEIHFNPENLQESSLNVEIMVNSINTGNEKRDGHLQSDDFFNAEKYPTITFSSDKITQSGDNSFVAHGQLTIKDVTKDIKLPFTLLGIQDHPQKENTKIAGVKIEHTINRNDYNVGIGNFAETAVVGGDVNLDIALEMQHTAQ